MNNNFEKFKKKTEQLVNHYNAGNYIFVIQQVNILLKKQPKNQFILNLLGSSHHKLGNLDIAKKVFLHVIQLNKNLSPFPSPINGGELIDTGLYNYIRHPIYTSILSTLFGYGLYSASGYKILLTIALLVLFFYKSKYEEKKLGEFGKRKGSLRSLGRCDNCPVPASTGQTE